MTSSPPAVMTRSEFINSLYTDERRDDAHTLWGALVAQPEWIDMARGARTAQNEGNGKPWETLTHYFGTTLQFTSDEDRWSSICPMIIGGVLVHLGLPL